MTEDAPLILTLRLDEPQQARFDALRSAHFPPERNFLSAHVTLFHALPGHDLPEIVRRLDALSRGTAPPEVSVGEPYPLGSGVAFRLVSPAADALRAGLSAEWSDRLTAQDRAKSRLHVTVQNKVSPTEAKSLLAELLAGHAPSRFASPGLALWRYRGGPWEAVRRFDFSG